MNPYAGVAQRQSVLVTTGKVAHNQKVSLAPEVKNEI